MKFLASAVRKDLQIRRRDPWVMLIWIGIPLLIGSLFTFLFGGEDGTTPKAHILIADEDGSLVSLLVASTFEQGPLADLFEVEAVEQEEGVARISSGEGSALLMIPEGFGDAVLHDQPAELSLVINPSQIILPGMIREVTSVLVDGAFYVQHIFGDELQTLVATMPPLGGDPANLTNENVSQLAVSLNERMGRLAAYLFPPLLQVETLVDEESTEGVSMSYGLLFFPGILLMALLFTAQGLSEEFWNEREGGTLRRLVSSPQRLGVFLGSKFVLSAMILSSLCGLLLLLGFLYHGIALIKLPISLLWLVLAGLVFYALMALVHIISPSHRAASLITFIAIFPLLMVGGSFFPFEAMPAWMAEVGKWTPNGIVLEQLKNYMLDRVVISQFFVAFLAVAGAGLFLLLLVSLRFRHFARGT